MGSPAALSPSAVSRGKATTWCGPFARPNHGPAKVRVETTGMFGARPVLDWTNTEPGARLTLPFNIDAAGRYAVRLTAAAAPDFGALRH